MSNPDLSAESRRWLNYAKEEIGAAGRMLREPDLVPRLACYLAQQAAEKALKGGLVFLGIEFPKTHDLARLRGMFPCDWDLGQAGENLANLTQWAVESRYPGDLPLATPSAAAAAVAKAKAVLEAIEHELIRNGWSNGPRSV
jgi:HEPN domain-containing protein